jgi:Tfp pilus assembly protein PilV
MKRRSLKCQEGLSYTEVLVSIAVISVGVVAASLNTVSVIRNNLLSSSHTIASNLAQDKLEQLSSLPIVINVDRCPNSGDQAISASGAPGGIYDRCWTIKDFAIGGGLKEVSVTVRWRDSEPRAVTLSTLILAQRVGP